jgi:hypothetical protein
MKLKSKVITIFFMRCFRVLFLYFDIMGEISFVEMEHGMKKDQVYSKFKIVEIWFSCADFPTITDVDHCMSNKMLRSINAVFPCDLLEFPGYLYVKSRDPSLVKRDAEYFHIRIDNKLIKLYINDSR